MGLKSRPSEKIRDPFDTANCVNQAKGKREDEEITASAAVPRIIKTVRKSRRQQVLLSWLFASQNKSIQARKTKTPHERVKTGDNAY